MNFLIKTLVIVLFFATSTYVFSSVIGNKLSDFWSFFWLMVVWIGGLMCLKETFAEYEKEIDKKS